VKKPGLCFRVGGHSGVNNICDKNLQRRRMWPVAERVLLESLSLGKECANECGQVLRKNVQCTMAGNKLSLLHIRSHIEISEAAAAPETTTSREACPAIKPEIQFSAFEAVDIRVGLIVMLH
jgi:hypothetical protein